MVQTVHATTRSKGRRGALVIAMRTLHEAFDTFVVSDELENMGVKALLGVLAMLRAMVWEYYTSHWKVRGFTFYGNHLLFSRLYEHIQGEFDGLAEKIIGVAGEDPAGIDTLPQMTMAQAWLSSIDHIDCRFERAENMERMLLDAIKQAKDACEAGGLLSPGIENMLDQMYDDHEGHIYLIQQTLKG